MKILLAKDGYTIEDVLSRVNTLASFWWQSQGFMVDEKGLVGQKLGKNNPDASRTTTWAEIREAPDGTKYFYSLSNDPRFVDWKQYWQDYGLDDCYQEIEIPLEWIVVDV